MMTGIQPPDPWRCEYCATYHIRNCIGTHDDRCDRFGCNCVYGGCEHVPHNYGPTQCTHSAEYFRNAREKANVKRVASCPRSGVCVIHLELGRTRYSTFLRKAVLELLCHHPTLSEETGRPLPPPPSAGKVLRLVEDYYSAWKSGTEEGSAYLDADDDAALAWKQQRQAEWDKEENVRAREADARDEERRQALRENKWRERARQQREGRSGGSPGR